MVPAIFIERPFVEILWGRGCKEQEIVLFMTEVALIHRLHSLSQTSPSPRYSLHYLSSDKISYRTRARILVFCYLWGSLGGYWSCWCIRLRLFSFSGRWHCWCLSLLWFLSSRRGLWSWRWNLGSKMQVFHRHWYIWAWPCCVCGHRSCIVTGWGYHDPQTP